LHRRGRELLYSSSRSLGVASTIAIILKTGELGAEGRQEGAMRLACAAGGALFLGKGGGANGGAPSTSSTGTPPRRQQQESGPHGGSSRGRRRGREKMQLAALAVGLATLGAACGIPGGAEGFRMMGLKFGRRGGRAKHGRTSKQAASKLHSQAMKEMDMLLADSGEWEPILSERKLKVWTRRFPGTDFVTVKAEAHIDASPEAMYEVLAPGDIDIVRTYNPLVDDGYDVEYLDKDSKISWSQTQAIWPIRPRDFVTYITRTSLSGGATALLQLATSHPDAPEGNDSSVVRGEINGMFYIRPVKGKPRECTFTMMHRFNPGGTIPTWLVNWLAEMKPASFIGAVAHTARRYDSLTMEDGSHPCQARRFDAPPCQWLQTPGGTSSGGRREDRASSGAAPPAADEGPQLSRLNTGTFMGSLIVGFVTVTFLAVKHWRAPDWASTRVVLGKGNTRKRPPGDVSLGAM
jgi:hypothetical protein